MGLNAQRMHCPPNPCLLPVLCSSPHHHRPSSVACRGSTRTGANQYLYIAVQQSDEVQQALAGDTCARQTAVVRRSGNKGGFIVKLRQHLPMRRLAGRLLFGRHMVRQL